MLIVQGDNGVLLPFRAIKDKLLNLTNATVKVDIKRGEDILSKTAEIIDANQGICQMTLSSSDLTIAGTYQYQWTAIFDDGRVFSSDIYDFRVNQRLKPVSSSTTPVTTWGGLSGLSWFNLNGMTWGNLKINGI